MAQPRLKAQWFVGLDGIAIPKAPQLKRSIAWNLFHESDKTCALCNTPVQFFRPLSLYASDYVYQCHIDHILPRSRGGQNSKDNLRITCSRCNLSKGAK